MKKNNRVAAPNVAHKEQVNIGEKIKKKFGRILLSVRGRDKSHPVVAAEGELTHREAIGAWHRKDVDVHDFYEVIEVIGHGHMGEISVVTRKPEAWEKSVQLDELPEKLKQSLSTSNLPGSATSGSNEYIRCYACKTVTTARMKTRDMAELLNEVSIMRRLDHPNIVQLFEVYSTKRKMWLITELCYGGDLYSRQLDEASAAVVMEQILRAVAYMHNLGVCHSDLKLENILYETPEPDSAIKLIDFGISQRFSAGTQMTRVVGTVYTLAPEIIELELSNKKVGYTEKTDIFSVGCIAFILLSGDYPFLQRQSDVKDEEKLYRLTQAKYTFGDSWESRNISEVAKDFIRGTIQKHPDQRWSAVEALRFVQETWIQALETTLDAEKEELDKLAENLPSIESRRKSLAKSGIAKKKRVKMQSTAFRGMQLYGHYGLMRKTALMTMARTMDKSMLTDLQDLFISMDRDHTGTITMNSLKEACLTYFEGRDFATDSNIEEIFRAIDTSGSGEVNYTEFLAAIAESQGLITLERLQEAFDRIDAEGKGYISKDDLRAILGKDANEEKINAMIEEANLFRNDGKIDYDEFLNLMFKDPIEGLQLMKSSSTEKKK